VVVELCHPNAKLPWQASPGDACYDLYCPEDVTIDYGETRVIKLGIKLQLEPGWEAQIRGRSSLQSVGLLFTVGTIDERYRKEIGAIVTSMHREVRNTVRGGKLYSSSPGVPYRIAAGERIAQMAIRRAPVVELVAGVVEPTELGGFGSTGR
jgi:dUTP pyrophosphatase